MKPKLCVTFMVFCAALVALAGSAAAAGHDCQIPSNPVENCSFETGNFAWWGYQDMAIPYWPLDVYLIGTSWDFFPITPTDGIFAVGHGFDGEGPDTIEVYQEVFLPAGAGNLLFDYRCGWDMVPYGATQDRTFRVEVQPSGGGPPLQSDLILTAEAGTTVYDTGDQLGIVDVSGFGGNSVRLSFLWWIPEPATGPGQCQFDNVLVEVAPSDYGDAPDPTYQTLEANDGAVHIIDGATHLGASVDPELDGQPNATATGDDADPEGDDENGVVFVGPMVPGLPASVDVTASASGLLNAWIDFNDDGDWADPGEQIFADESLMTGVNSLPFAVPPAPGAMPSWTFARFRFSSVGGLLPSGPAPDGEVEDHYVLIEEPLDWGDAPDPTYPTLASSFGAVHFIDGVTFLGASVDPELDGQPNSTATGDDADPEGDDEDGVVFTSRLVPGSSAGVDVTASVPGFLSAWLDFDASGTWDPGEEIFSAEPLAAGVNSLLVPIPPAAAWGPTFARFRFTDMFPLPLPPDGFGLNGEVEDYQVEINGPPDAVNDSGTGYITNEDNPFVTGNVLGNDTDPNGDPLFVNDYDASGTIGLLSDNGDGTFSYDPNDQFEWLAVGEQAFDTFDYEASDGAETDWATVTITINGVNDEPTADDDAYDTDEDTIRTVGDPGILIGDTDPDLSDTLEVVAVNASGTAGLVNYNALGWINYDPDGQFEYLAVGESDTDSFEYTISDGNGGSDTATVTITIYGVNDQPTAVNDTADTDEDTALAGIVVLDDDTDPDTSDVLAVDGLNDSGTAGVVTWNLDDTFDYDPDGQFEYLAVGESETDSFEYTVTDGNGGFDTATVTITIHGVNDPPTAVDDTDDTDEDTLLEDIIVLDDDTDPDDSDVLTVESFDDTGTIGAVTLTDDTFDYDPVGVFDNLAFGAMASDIFTYTVSDGHGGTDDATVTITVHGVNDPPVGVDDVYNTDEDTDLTVEAPGVLENDTDPDDVYTLKVSGVDDSSLIGTLDMWPVVDGSFYYTPTDQFQYLGRSETFTETFTYTVTDDLSEEDSAIVSIAIAGVNDPPTAGDDTANTLEETPRTIAVLGNDSDPDISDVLFVATVGLPANGDASTNGTTVTYTPTQEFSGPDVFTYTVSDGELTDIAQVDIFVGATNDPPNAEYNTVTTKEDTLVKFNVLDNDSDPDGDSIMVVALGEPQHGAATYNGPIVTYTPTLNFNGNDVFTYTISDGELEDTAEIEVVVESVNDPPVISAIPDQFTDMNEPVGPINFTIGDVETPVGDLALTSASSNTALVPVSAIHINRAGANCTLTIYPTWFTWGTSIITITVSDGTDHASEEFVLTVIEGRVERVYLPDVFKPYLPPYVVP